MKLQTKLILGACFIVLAAVNACKKDSAEPASTATTNTQNCKPEIQYLNDTIQYKGYYNANLQLIKQVHYEKGIPADSSLVVYSASTVVITDMGSYPQVNTYTLGSNGYASKLITDNGSFKDTTYYTYDNNGFLIKSIARDLVANYVINDGNIISEEDTYPGDSSHYATEYYLDKIDKVGFNKVDVKEFLLGKSSKNLPKKYSIGKNPDTFEYVWTIENGLPVKANVKSTIDGVVTNDVSRHTYLCR